MKTLINLIILVLLFSGLNTSAQNSPKLKSFYQSISAEKIGNINDAISVLEKIYSSEKEDYLINLRLGWLYYLKGNFPKSVNYYNNAVRLSNKSIEALIGLTYPYSRMNKKNKLKDIYLEILKKDKNNYTANLNLGLLYFNEGDYLNAIIFMEKIIEDYPSNYSANLYLGWANYYEGGNSKAHHYFERALIALPNDPSALKGYNATK